MEKVQKPIVIQVEPEPNMDEEITKENQGLFKNIQLLITFGKVIGLLPFNLHENYASNQLKSVNQKIVSLGGRIGATHSVYSALILISVSCNLILGLWWAFHGEVSVNTPLDIALSFRLTFFNCWGWTVYLIFFFRRKSLHRLVKNWQAISSKLEYSAPDTSLRWHVYVLMCIVFASAILENLMLDYFRFGTQCKNSSHEVLDFECYYRKIYPHWSHLLDYHPVICIFILITHKLMWYALNYVDFLMAVIARALYAKFKILNETAMGKLRQLERSTDYASVLVIDTDILPDNEFTSKSPKDEIPVTQEAWLKVCRDHRNLCNLLTEVENFFSLIIFGSYTFNLYFISLQLFDGLNGSDDSASSTSQAVYEVWSILHLLLRTGIVTICCSRINKYAHEIRDIYRECPVEFYDSQIAREDMRVTSGPQVGLSGMGCFVLKQSSLLSIVSVIFTVEIILLQCLNTNTVSSS